MLSGTGDVNATASITMDKIRSWWGCVERNMDHHPGQTVYSNDLLSIIITLTVLAEGWYWQSWLLSITIPSSLILLIPACYFQWLDMLLHNIVKVLGLRPWCWVTINTIPFTTNQWNVALLTKINLHNSIIGLSYHHNVVPIVAMTPVGFLLLLLAVTRPV